MQPDLFVTKSESAFHFCTTFNIFPDKNLDSFKYIKFANGMFDVSQMLEYVVVLF